MSSIKDALNVIDKGNLVVKNDELYDANKIRNHLYVQEVMMYIYAILLVLVLILIYLYKLPVLNGTYQDQNNRLHTIKHMRFTGYAIVDGYKYQLHEKNQILKLNDGVVHELGMLIGDEIYWKNGHSWRKIDM